MLNVCLPFYSSSSVVATETPIVVIQGGREIAAETMTEAAGVIAIVAKRFSFDHCPTIQH